MLRIIAVGIMMVGATVMFHATGTIWWNMSLHRKLPQHKGKMQSWDTLYALASTAVVLLLLLFSEAVLWAGLYFVLADETGLRPFQNALYFSLETFTTVGYGDITLKGGWRILTGIEAMNGILLFGWSTAMLYNLVNFIWTHTMQNQQAPAKNNHSKGGHG